MALLEEQLGAWKPVSRGAGIAWLCFYALFLLYAFADRSGFLILDYVNLIIHEGGHFFFSWFGNTIMILGGTLGELLVPLFAPSISSGNAKLPASRSLSSGSSKISPTSVPTWPTPAPPRCPLSAPKKATGPFSSPSGASLPKTRKSAPPSASWAS